METKNENVWEGSMTKIKCAEKKKVLFSSVTLLDLPFNFQPSVSTLPQLNQLITYQWLIVHAAHGQGETARSGGVLFPSSPLRISNGMTLRGL